MANQPCFTQRRKGKSKGANGKQQLLRSLSFSRLCVNLLPNPDLVVTIQRRRIGDNDLVAFAQPIEYLDGADGIASEFNRATHCLGAIRGQYKHANGLLCLAKRRPADFQHIFEPLKLDGSVNTQVRSRTRRQWAFQVYVALERAFASSRIDTRDFSLDQAVARVDGRGISDTHVFDLRFRNSQYGFQ